MSTTHSRPSWGLKLYALTIAVLLLLPTLVVVPISFTARPSLVFPPRGLSTRWYANFFENSDWYGSALLSLRVGLVVTVLATALGTAGAIALTSGRGRWRAPVRALVLAPMIVPGVITAIGIFYVFTELRLTQTFLGFVLAHTVLAIPFVIITVSASLRSFDRELLLASASLGGSPATTFRKVMLPLIAPGVLTGALFAFLTSFDEAIVSLFLAGPFTRTLPVQIYQSVTAEIDPTIAAASTMLLALTTIVIVGIGLVTMSRERREAR